MSRTYTKLADTLTASSVWNEPDPVRIVWVTMLSKADADGVVRGSVGGLAHLAREPKEATEHALAVLSSPDPDSSRKNDDGRRIVAVEGGWQLINHQFYRELGMSEETKRYWREKQREHRLKAQNKEGCQRQSKTGQRPPASASASASVLPEGNPNGGADSGRPASEREVIDYCATLQLPRSDAVYYWAKWLGNGFTNNEKPMKDWQAVIRSHKAAGYLPSQKPTGSKAKHYKYPEPPPAPRIDSEALARSEEFFSGPIKTGQRVTSQPIVPFRELVKKNERETP